MLLSNISSAAALYKEAEDIQAFLEGHYPIDNPAACEDRGKYLEIYLARTGKMLADAKYWKDEQTNSALMMAYTEALKEQNKKLWTPTTISKKVEALCKNENFLVNWIERLNRSCTHQLSFMVTMISKHKAEMMALNGR